MKNHLLRIVAALLVVVTLPLLFASCSGSGEEVPEGMQICSSSDREYLFYVPLSWVVNSGSGSSSAYYSLADRSSVRVASVVLSSYNPDESLNIDGYWDLCEADYRESFEEYAFVSEEATVLGERNAMAYTYTAKVSGTAYKIRQIICVYNEMFYTLTYTSTPEAFDSHLEDLDKIRTEFKFR